MSHTTDVIEKDHYHKSLFEAMQASERLAGQLYAENSPSLPQANQLAAMLREAWMFRQHACPKCGDPVESHFVMWMFSPARRYWNCPKCGVL